MAKKILKVATFGILGSNLFGGKKKAPEPEKGPVVMPIADDEEVRRAKKRSIIEQMSRGGRSSTMLSSDSDSLGG